MTQVGLTLLSCRRSFAEVRAGDREQLELADDMRDAVHVQEAGEERQLLGATGLHETARNVLRGVAVGCVGASIEHEEGEGQLGAG